MTRPVIAKGIAMEQPHEAFVEVASQWNTSLMQTVIPRIDLTRTRYAFTYGLWNRTTLACFFGAGDQGIRRPSDNFT